MCFTIKSAESVKKQVQIDLLVQTHAPLFVRGRFDLVATIAKY
jgi:hypothetical protein